MKKEESGALQGIAVLLMIFHHCFLYSYMFLDGFIRHPEFTEHFARSTRIAIAICAFVSGYGIFHVLKGKDGYAQEYPDMIKRVLKIYAKYWIAILITLAVEVLIFHEMIKWNELLGNLTGFEPTYNTTWWYIREYMFMLLIAPLIKTVLQGGKKRRLRLLITFCILAVGGGIIVGLGYAEPVIAFLRKYVQMVLLVIFFEGYFAAFLQDKLKEKINHRDHPVVLVFIAGFLLAACAYAIRYTVAFDAGDSKPDVFIAPFFILGAVLIFRTVTVLRKVFGFLGSNLLYMWFIHGLIWKEAFVFLTLKTTPVIYYSVIVISSLLISVFLTWVEKMLFIRCKSDKAQA